MRFLYVFLTMLEDIFIISGLSVIIGTTFCMAPVYGWYLLGITLTLIGVVMARK
ncbi:hypothetical protein [Bacillus thuringiensis]|uniref:Uncharacterized protein n=1 Tax=Bacillus thuringiensis TaxID=1428 RepID=A0A9W3SDE8_BACTU|nr:hypothetical protein [Bacillus thuringiensis]ANS49393.1 hypothetical protein BT246_40470 [Bacillus thuringiensis]